jgi:hypothetical protein
VHRTAARPARQKHKARFVRPGRSVAPCHFAPGHDRSLRTGFCLHTGLQPHSTPSAASGDLPQCAFEYLRRLTAGDQMPAVDDHRRNGVDALVQIKLFALTDFVGISVR